MHLHDFYILHWLTEVNDCKFLKQFFKFFVLCMVTLWTKMSFMEVIFATDFPTKNIFFQY